MAAIFPHNEVAPGGVVFHCIVYHQSKYNEKGCEKGLEGLGGLESLGCAFCGKEAKKEIKMNGVPKKSG